MADELPEDAPVRWVPPKGADGALLPQLVAGHPVESHEGDRGVILDLPGDGTVGVRVKLKDGRELGLSVDAFNQQFNVLVTW